MKYIVAFILFAVFFTFIYKWQNDRFEKSCNTHVYKVTETGQCTFNKYGSGRCAVILDNSRLTYFREPAVKGQKVLECWVRKDKSDDSHFEVKE